MRSANSFGPAELPGQLVGAAAGVVKVGGEALLEVLAGVGDDVVAELGADQDADREREEDGRKRGGVIASRCSPSRQARWSIRDGRVRRLTVQAPAAESQRRAPALPEILRRLRRLTCLCRR